MPDVIPSPLQMLLGVLIICWLILAAMSAPTATYNVSSLPTEHQQRANYKFRACCRAQNLFNSTDGASFWEQLCTYSVSADSLVSLLNTREAAEIDRYLQCLTDGSGVSGECCSMKNEKMKEQ